MAYSRKIRADDTALPRAVAAKAGVSEIVVAVSGAGPRGAIISLDAGFASLSPHACKPPRRA